MFADDFSTILDNPSKKYFGLEMPVFISENYSPVLKEHWGSSINNPVDYFLEIQTRAKNMPCSFISVYFNIPEPQDSKVDDVLSSCAEVLKNILQVAKAPLMIKLSANAAWDIKLAKALIPILDREVVISPIQAANYKEITDLALNSKFNHKFVMRTPIDINLTKELNILSVDNGVNASNILIDPDMGCIGYGIDYGYSIIERICLARQEGDKMLNMPIIVYAGEEAYKAKEAKSNDFAPSWGELNERALMWETMTASALLSAGANICVLWSSNSLEVLAKEFCEVVCP